MISASVLLREARRSAGLTQATLAGRAGLTQSVVARMERPGSNPTVAVLERALNAAGASLGAVPIEQVDETQIIERLRLTPEERLRTFQRSRRNLDELLRDARWVTPG